MSVKVGGKALSDGDYKLAPDSLTIPSPPSGSFQVSGSLQGASGTATLAASVSRGLAGSISSEGTFIKHIIICAQVEIETELKPQDNTSLEGLYKSSSGCPAEL